MKDVVAEQWRGTERGTESGSLRGSRLLPRPPSSVRFSLRLFAEESRRVRSVRSLPLAPLLGVLASNGFLLPDFRTPDVAPRRPHVSVNKSTTILSQVLFEMRIMYCQIMD